MGVNIFRKSCYVFGVEGEAPEEAINPNPLNFKILETIQVGDTVIAKIEYPDCTNFEGIKLCVFTNTSAEEIKNLEEVDPHFSENRMSPTARFAPTEEGARLAKKLAHIIGGDCDG